MDKILFVQKYFPLALEAEKVFNVNANAILAQAAIESQWGDSYGARVRNNFFGITAYGPTNKYWDGSKSLSNISGLYFRVYTSPENGFMDFARLISEKYSACARVSNNIAQYAVCIANSPYINEANGDNREAYRKAVETSGALISQLSGPIRDSLEKELKKKDFTPGSL